MPMITVQLSVDPDERLAREAMELVTGLTSDILGKDRSVSVVAVEFIPPRFWYIAGRSAAERRQPGFFVDTRITDGTNDKDQKARYIAAVFAALDGLLGGAHPESYVHVDDARADAYGYGGKTSERRYVEAHPAR